MVLDVVNVTKLTSSTFTALQTAVGVGGIVGYGTAGASEDNTPFLWTSLSDIGTKYGTSSALYAGAYLFFLNGGSNIWTVQASSSAGAGDTQSGDGSTRVFTVAGVTSQMLKGSVTVTVGSALTEGTDFIVDYSNDKIYFADPPASGTDNVIIAWRESTATQYGTALDELVSQTVNLVELPYNFDSTIEGEILTHLTEAASAKYPRFGFLKGAYEDATNILTLASSNASENLSICANRCGYGGTSDETDWLEFRDPAAAFMGVVSSLLPGESAHYKETLGLNWYKQFTTTQLGVIGSSGLLGSYINVFYDPRYLGGTGKMSYGGWTNDSDGDFRYIDNTRLYLYLEDRLKAILSDPGIIGTSHLIKSDLEEIFVKIMTVLNDVYKRGWIRNPADLFSTNQVYPVDIEALTILRKPAESRTDTENEKINQIDGTRILEGTVYYDQAGVVHQIDLGLGMV